MERYIEHSAKRKRTWREDQRILLKDVLPFFGREPHTLLHLPSQVKLVEMRLQEECRDAVVEVVLRG